MNQGTMRSQANTQTQTQTQGEPPYLFYSENCQHSQRLIKMIRENPALANAIKPVSVDGATRLPPEVTSVPCIRFNGKFFTGNDSFGWVQHTTQQMKGGSQGDPNAHLRRDNMNQVPNAASVAADAMKRSQQQQGGGDQAGPNDPQFAEIGTELGGADLNLMGEQGKFSGQIDNAVSSGDGFMSLQEFGDGNGMSGKGIPLENRSSHNPMMSNQQTSNDPTRFVSSQSNKMSNDAMSQAMNQMDSLRNRDVPPVVARVGGGSPPVPSMSMSQGNMGQMGQNQMGQMPQMRQQPTGQPMGQGQMGQWPPRQ